MNAGATPWRSFLWPGAVVAGLATVTAFFFLFNPAEYPVFPRCLFQSLTGWQCPGCGGQRALHQLLHGHILEALRLNALVVILLPVGLWLGLREGVRAATGRTWPAVFNHIGWLWVLAGMVVVFGLARNLPLGPWR
jgi:hypothetical protein